MTSLQTFDITLNGFTNPSTTQPSDSFELSIFYEEGVNEVSHYLGSALTVTATASKALEVSASLTETKTGEIQTLMTITGTMDPDNPIEK